MRLYSKRRPETFNCAAIIPDVPIHPAIATIDLTLLPYKLPIASAIDKDPKNSLILGIKNIPNERNSIKPPKTQAKIKYRPLEYDSETKIKKSSPLNQVATIVHTKTTVEKSRFPIAYSDIVFIPLLEYKPIIVMIDKIPRKI